ncbi:MAG TPA: glycosyltransferase, partial [Symbiobacteriaceae bacterium]|nr:glycosyltransferase [Symbiobacteriaceae bacterium]
SRTRHRYIVSKGPRADEFDLPDTMWGEARVPQTSIIPEVDLVITHGGNNTVTEALHFGKPMVVLPCSGISALVPLRSFSPPTSPRTCA